MSINKSDNTRYPDELLPPPIQHYIDELIYSVQEPNQILAYILDIALELLDAENGSLRLVNRHSNQLELRVMRLRSGKQPKPSHTNLDLYGDSIVAQVVQMKQPLLIDDLSMGDWPRKYHPLDKHTKMFSEIAVPLLSNDKKVVVGVLNVESTERGAFTQEHVRYLEALARRALYAVQRALLLEAIRAIGKKVLGEDQEALLITTVEMLANIMLVPVCSIWLTDPNKGSLDLRKAVGQPVMAPIKQGEILRNDSFIGQAVLKGKPIITKNVQIEPTFLHQDFAKANGWKSAVAVPIMAGSGKSDDILGAIFLCATEKRNFSNHDINLAMAFSDQVAIALKQAQFLADKVRQIEVTKSMQKVNQALITATDLSEILDLIVEEATQLLEGDGGVLYLMDESLNSNKVVATTVSTVHVRNMQTPLDRSLSGWVVQHNEAVICDADDNRIDQNIARRINLETIIAVPLSHNNRVIGAIVVVNRQGRQSQFSQNDRNVLEMFAAQATIAINRMRLYERTERHSKHLDVINSILRESVESIDVDLLLKKATQHISQTLGYKVDIGLVESESVVLKATAYQGEYIPRQDICDKRIFDFHEGIIGAVAYSGQPLVVSDVTVDPRYFPCFSKTKSEMAVPITSESRTIGILNIESDKFGAFIPEEQRIFIAIASGIALALGNAQRLKELTTLHKISTAISQAQDLKEVMKEIVTAFNASASTLFVTEPSGSQLMLAKQVGLPSAVQRRILHLEKGQSIAGKVLESGKPIIVIDMLSDERSDQTIKKADNLRSLASVPIKIEEHIKGVLTIITEDIRYFSEHDIQLLEAVASNIGIAIEKQQMEGNYKRLFQTARDAIVILDPQGNIVDMNARAVELTGYSSEELNSMNITELIVGEEKIEEVRRRVKILASGKEESMVEFQLRQKDGSLLFMESNPTPVQNESKKVTAIQAIWRDITDRKQNETVISRQNDLLQSLLELSRVPFNNQAMAVLKERACRLACQLTNSDDALINDVLHSSIRFSPTLSPSDDNAISVTINKVAATGESIISNTSPLEALDYANTTSNTQKAQHLLCIPLKSKNQVIGVLSVIRKASKTALPFSPEDDIRLKMFAHSLTLAMEYVRLEEHQRKQHAAAKVLEQMSLVGAFLSHKVGGYLGAVAFTTRELRQQLQSEDKTTSELMDTLEEISRVAVHVVRQLRGLEQPLQLSPNEAVYLQPLIDQAIKQAKVPNKIIAKLYNLELPPVSGSGQLLREVFEGVIRNAIDAMPNGGTLTIKGQRSLDSYEAILYFNDTGAGIDPKLEERLFDPFFSTKKELHGLGIGLWLSRLYLQTLGGDIKINRKIGQGASFEIRLLTTQLTEQNTKVFSSVGQGENIPIVGEGEPTFILSTRPKRILVVEDESVWQKTLETALKRRNLQSKLATSYQEGLSALTLQRFDLFIIDVRLVSYDEQNQEGLKLIEHILADDPTARILVLSALDELLTIAQNKFRKYQSNIFFISKADTAKIESILDDVCSQEANI
ncbi:MAG: GAF domain-containing protein [Ardenticatenaceae bacterium]|nr:GAF domain-containing protein [Ardenticatenaceae bacterium]